MNNLKRKRYYKKKLKMIYKTNKLIRNLIRKYEKTNNIHELYGEDITVSQLYSWLNFEAEEIKENIKLCENCKFEEIFVEV